MSPSSKNNKLDFKYISKSNDDSKNNIGITADGKVFSWGKCNQLGQLGRPGKAAHILPALFANPDNDNRSSTKEGESSGLTAHVDVKASKAYTGGTRDAGHSAVIDTEGNLWLTGCDRWQQLGLGANINGASGYTWKNGRLWQESFHKNMHLMNLMKSKIRDVAIGGDHTLILAENQMDVYSFGKGAEGQLGIFTKPFVSCPVRAKELSSTRGEPSIAAVCAVRHCSFTLDKSNEIMKRFGKCRLEKDLLLNALRDCREKANNHGLVSKVPPTGDDQ